MPELPETMYCSQQIHIPPMFPYILRQYAKAAIKTQPLDLLRWSCHYFRALSLNAETPTKKRIEYPEPKNYMGLTPGFLKVLVRQVGNNPTINVNYLQLLQKWDGICLREENLIKILLTGRFTCATEIPWYKFIAVCVGYLTENLTQTMILICHTLTEEPDGGSAMIPVDVFLDLYKFLAMLDCSGTWFEVDTWFGPCIHKERQQSIPKGLLVFPETSALFPVYQNILATTTLSTLSAVPPEFSQNGKNAPQLSEQQETEIKTTDMSEKSSPTNVSEQESNESAPSAPPSEQNLEEENEEGEIVAADESTESFKNVAFESEPQAADDNTDHTQKDQFKALYDQYVDHTGPQDDKSFLTRNQRHLHLNRFLQSMLISPSLLTENMSMFVPVDASSTLYTIYPPKKSTEDVQQPEEPQLIRYQIDEVMGIGPVVDKETMEYFIEYIQETAKTQHGMIMPRNLTHFQCPPMENFDYVTEKKKEELEN